MRTRSIVAVVALFASLAPAQPTAAPSTRPAYVGSFEYRYDGFRVRADVPDAGRMRWTILEGGDRVGESAEEKVDRRTIAPNIEFVSWTERDGTMVVQIVDLNAMRVTTALIAGGRRMVLQGTIARLEPAMP